MPSPDRGREARPRAGITWTVLLLGLRFGADAQRISEGLIDGGLPPPDIACPPRPTEAAGRRAGPAATLEALEFDRRMKAARAVVITTGRLDAQTLFSGLPFEAATRARQAGVPCYAVARRNALSRFDARILDLQVVIEARSPEALRQAGESLAEIV